LAARDIAAPRRILSRGELSLADQARGSVDDRAPAVGERAELAGEGVRGRAVALRALRTRRPCGTLRTGRAGVALRPLGAGRAGVALRAGSSVRSRGAGVALGALGAVGALRARSAVRPRGAGVALGTLSAGRAGVALGARSAVCPRGAR